MLSYTKVIQEKEDKRREIGDKGGKGMEKRCERVNLENRRKGDEEGIDKGKKEKEKGNKKE